MRRKGISQFAGFASVLVIVMLVVAVALFFFTGNSSGAPVKRIVRVGHNQSTNHPTHKGMEAFEKYIEEKLGYKYDVQLYPSELLGSQTDMVQLNQTGAIDFVVASNSIMETFEAVYKIFNLPYLFSSPRAYHEVMDDPLITGSIFTSTKKSGFEVVTWIDAGTRNFYTIKTPVHSPENLKGLKIRVQQSPTNVEMMRLLGGSATPMGFGEVYTALQAGILDGAENNEMALVDNGHGDICKYYSYDMHQMVPDLVLGSTVFLDSLTAEERAIFEEGFKVINAVEREEWKKAVVNAIDRARSEKGVTFITVDVQPFKDAMSPLHEQVLNKNPYLREIYEKIQLKNKMYPAQDA